MRSLLILLATLTLASHGQIDRSQKPLPGPAPAAAFPDAVIHEFPNGLRVFLIHDDRKPTISLRLTIRGGSSLDGEQAGLADLVATLLNRGTANRDATAFAKAVDSLGATLEASASADAISISTSGLVKFTDDLLPLFAEAVLTPAFTADQFEKEQKRTLSALAAAKKQPDSLAANLQRAVLFGAHPYGRITTPESIVAITREDLTAYHNRWFAPNNASLAIVGDVQPDEIFPKIEKVLGKWERKDIPPRQSVAITPRKGLSVHLLDLTPSVQSIVSVTHLAPPRNFPDLPELNVVNSTLGGGFSGRLFQNLRETHGYTYGSSSAFGYHIDTGWFQATAETRPEVTAAAIREILSEMRRIREQPIPADELELQRQYNIGNYLLSLESAGRIATRIQDIWLYGLDPAFYKAYAHRMSLVTPEKAKDLAQKYLHPDDATIIVVGDAKTLRTELEKIAPVTLYDTEFRKQP